MGASTDRADLEREFEENFGLRPQCTCDGRWRYQFSIPRAVAVIKDVTSADAPTLEMQPVTSWTELREFMEETITWQWDQAAQLDSLIEKLVRAGGNQWVRKETA
jgi:hypothetical protein